MSFPTTSVLDNFNRVDAEDIGTNWTNPIFPGNSPLFIVSNTVGHPIDSSFREEYWNVGTFGADSEAYYTFSTKPADGAVAYLCVRIAAPATTGVDCYYAEIAPASGTDAGGIYRVDNNAFTLLGASLSQEWATGDGFGLEAIGDAIKVYRRSSGTWSELASRTEGTYGSAGYIGMGCQGPTARLDDFGGGTVVAAAAGNPWYAYAQQ